jgi:hypothetical protein
MACAGVSAALQAVGWPARADCSFDMASTAAVPGRSPSVDIDPPRRTHQPEFPEWMILTISGSTCATHLSASARLLSLRAHRPAQTSLKLSGGPKRSPAVRVLDGGPVTKQLHRGEVVGLGPEQLVQLLGQLVAVGVATPPTEEAVIGLPKLAERRSARR